MIIQQLLDTVARYPQRPALIYAKQRWDWAALFQQIKALNGALAAKGIGVGDKVVLWADNSPAFVLAYYAVLMRGAILVPLDPALKAGDFSLRNEPFKAALTTRKLFSRCQKALDIEQIWICEDNETAQQWSGLELQPCDEMHIATADAPALLQYSSGSTGTPKALYRRHGECYAEIQHFRRTCQMQAEDRIFSALPLFHAHGMANSFWASLGSGACLVLMAKPQPFALQGQRALDLLQQEKITVFPAVPLQFETLLHCQAVDLSAIRLCFSAGNPLSEQVFQDFLAKFNLPIRQLYGCSEAGSVCIDLDSPLEASPRCVGRPMHGVEVQIWNQQQQSVATGEIGDIAFKSPALTQGYLNDDNPSFINGWFLIGDMGSLDAQGYLYIAGRKAFVIEVAGHKVYAHEIEAVLKQQPKISEVAVIGYEDDKTGEGICAFVVAKDLSEANFFDYCQQHLAIFKRPQKIRFISALPKNALGKISKTALLALL